MLAHHHAEYLIHQAHERAAEARLAKQARHAAKHRRRAPGRARLVTARLLVRLAERLLERPSTAARSHAIDASA